METTERSAALLLAAVSAAEEHGPALTMSHVAERAGVSRPLLYLHFADLAAVRAAVLEWITQDVLGVILRAVEPTLPDHPVSALRAGAHAYMRWVAEHPTLSRFALQHAYSRTESGRILYRDLTSLIADLLREHGDPRPADAAPLELIATTMIAIGEATATWWIDEDFVPPVGPAAEQLAHQYELLLADLGVLSGGSGGDS